MVEFKRINVKEYLSNFDPKMQELASELRDLILELEPEVAEVIKYKSLFYEQNGVAYIFIVIHKSQVNLQFARGRELKELGYPLEGSGKNIRHIKIFESSDIDDSIRNLIIKAFKLK